MPVTVSPGCCGIQAYTYASLLIHEGRSLPYVTAALGHSSAKTTLDHYAHLYAEAELGTGVRMADAVPGPLGCAEGRCAHSAPTPPSGALIMAKDPRLLRAGTSHQPRAISRNMWLLLPSRWE